MAQHSLARDASGRCTTSGRKHEEDDKQQDPNKAEAEGCPVHGKPASEPLTEPAVEHPLGFMLT